MKLNCATVESAKQCINNLRNTATIHLKYKPGHHFTPHCSTKILFSALRNLHFLFFFAFDLLPVVWSGCSWPRVLVCCGGVLAAGGDCSGRHCPAAAPCLRRCPPWQLRASVFICSQLSIAACVMCHVIELETKVREDFAIKEKVLTGVKALVC